MSVAFDYATAFSRNIGWVSEEEQTLLKSKRVAIAGMGGVGGSHLLTLARLGVGAFNIADFDAFELANFNRQAGATVSRLGQPKVDMLAEMALDINPALDIKRFPQGVATDNMEDFFAGVDIYVDSLDFFAFAIRRAVFAACHAQGIPAVTAAPLGMSAAFLSFMPGGMSFEDYFQLEGCSEAEQGLRFLAGLAPAALHRRYLVDPSRLDLHGKKGPSTPMACELCAGVAGAEALKILLNRGKIYAAPYAQQFDAYTNTFRRVWLPGGNRNPLQRFKIARARPMFAAIAARPKREETAPASVVERILDVARWAPSGDNTQPWRVEIIDDARFVVHGFDTRAHCVYDLDGRPSQMAIGAFLENVRIAAAQHGLKAEAARREDAPPERPTFDLSLSADPDIAPDPLYPYIPLRATQRRPLSPQPLTGKEKALLEKALGKGYAVAWLEGWRQKARAAWLMFKNAKVRFTMPEAYEVHKSVIEWNARFSKDKIPDQAVGLDPVATRMMKWSMQSWERIAFLNAWLAGTLMPRIELDLLPGLFCAGHFALLAQEEALTVDACVEAGRAMQRFWLTAAKLGLQAQPEMTPIIFTRYHRQGVEFTREEKLRREVGRLKALLDRLIGAERAERTFFMGRIGRGSPAAARSVRLDVRELLVASPEAAVRSDAE
jgi:nitroreductase